MTYIIYKNELFLNAYLIIKTHLHGLSRFYVDYEDFPIFVILFYES